MKLIATRTAALALVALSAAACSSAPKPAPVGSDPLPVRAAPFELTTTSRGPMVTLNDVLFDFEQASLRPEARGIVRQAAEYLKDNPDRVALVEGHTDTTGAARYNVMLSEARSAAVRDALLKAGVSDSRIKTSGFGEARPVASNQSPEGRKQNRRVEIVFKQLSGN